MTEPMQVKPKQMEPRWGSIRPMDPSDQIEIACLARYINYTIPMDPMDPSSKIEIHL
jgi:hypothetical protein